MTKILVVGDLHGDIPKGIPKRGIDLVLLTGDLGKADLARKRFFDNIKRGKEGLEELERDANFEKSVHMQIHDSTLKVLKHFSKIAPVYSLQGNVGIPGISDIRDAKKKHGLKLPSTKDAVDAIRNVNITKNRLRILDKQRIGFLEFFTDACWVKEFKPSNYKKSMRSAKKQTDKAKKALDRFGDYLDILLCHQPPYGVLDKVNFPGLPASWKGKHAGSKAIYDYIIKFKPRYVICGHIHEAAGKKKIGKTEVYNLGCGEWKILDL